MALMLRDPLFSEPFRLMDDVFGRVLGSRVTAFVPALDVRETDDEYLVLVDLPGVKSEDVTIELSDRVLTVSGTRVAFETGEAQRVERPYGSFARSLTLAQGVESDKIMAEYHDGVLELRIPKSPEAKPKRIALSSGGQKATEA